MTENRDRSYFNPKKGITQLQTPHHLHLNIGAYTEAGTLPNGGQGTTDRFKSKNSNSILWKWFNLEALIIMIKDVNVLRVPERTTTSIDPVSIVMFWWNKLWNSAIKNMHQPQLLSKFNYLSIQNNYLTQLKSKLKFQQINIFRIIFPIVYDYST